MPHFDYKNLLPRKRCAKKFFWILYAKKTKYNKRKASWNSLLTCSTITLREFLVSPVLYVATVLHFISQISKSSEGFGGFFLCMLFLYIVILKSSLVKEVHRIPSSYQFLFCFETSYYICHFLCNFPMLACQRVYNVYIHIYG